MAVLGTDIGGVLDIDPFLTLVDGPRAAAEAVMTSILHSAGVLWWAPDLGYDLNQHLHGFFDEERIRLGVQQQAEQEERVESADVSVVRLGTDLQVMVELVLTQDGSKVSFTITIDQLGEVLDAAVSN